MAYYWTERTFTDGENRKPENWYRVMITANEKIDEYISDYGLNPVEDADQIQDFSALLAEDWLTHGLLPDELKP